MSTAFTVTEDRGRITFTCASHVIDAVYNSAGISHVTLEDEHLNIERFDCPIDELPELAQAVCDGMMVLT